MGKLFLALILAFYTIRSLRIIITTQRSIKMNPNRKLKNFHLTYKGHYILHIPFQCKWLAYCHEEEQEEHTHCVVQLYEGITKNEMILELNEWLEIPCEIDVATHKNIQSAIGYHLGFGDKKRCNPEINVMYPIGFNADDYIKNKVMHKPRSTFEHVERNRLLLETNNKVLVDEGYIPLEKLTIIIQNKAEYGRQTEDSRGELPEAVPNPWGLQLIGDRDNKKCHFWMWSHEPDRGKTTLAKKLVDEFRGYYKSSGWEYWTIREDCDFVVLDEYRGALKAENLDSMCDGTYDYRIIHRGHIRLVNKPLVIVFSNLSIEECHPFMKNLLYARFNEICLDGMAFIDE